MLPSLSELCSSDDATVRALAETCRCLLGTAGLGQDRFYIDRSITSVLNRLESAERDDAQRVEPSLASLKHLRDILECTTLVSRVSMGRRAASDPVDMPSSGAVHSLCNC